MTQLIKYKKTSPEIKVIEKFSPTKTVFDNKEDFAAYLNEHREELDKYSTCKLNKMFTIPDYWITKIKGEISLKKSPKRVTKEPVNDELRDDINKIKETLNSLITQLYDKGLIE